MSEAESRSATPRPPVALPPSVAEFQWIDMKVVKAAVCMSESWIRSEVAAGRFPAPMRFSGRCSRWTAASIRTYLIERAAEVAAGQNA
jgi:predicted DNA-binding transcriptional regulator AlpA